MTQNISNEDSWVAINFKPSHSPHIPSKEKGIDAANVKSGCEQKLHHPQRNKPNAEGEIGTLQRKTDKIRTSRAFAVKGAI